jgi:hypothetical protein
MISPIVVIIFPLAKKYKRFRFCREYHCRNFPGYMDFSSAHRFLSSRYQ